MERQVNQHEIGTTTCDPVASESPRSALPTGDWGREPNTMRQTKMKPNSPHRNTRTQKKKIGEWGIFPCQEMLEEPLGPASLSANLFNQLKLSRWQFRRFCFRTELLQVNPPQADLLICLLDVQHLKVIQLYKCRKERAGHSGWDSSHPGQTRVVSISLLGSSRELPTPSVPQKGKQNRGESMSIHRYEWIY